MRLVLLSVAPLLMSATVAPTPPAAPHAGDALAKAPAQTGRNCRGRIDTVRQEHGLPKLDPDKDGSGQPMLILAVDRQIDGCEVLVMRNNLDDIRPLPEYSQTARLRPAH
jgi:hypothetical protein